MTAEPILVDCTSGAKPHYLASPILAGAPCGFLCPAFGDEVELDAEGKTLPHKTADLLAMIRRGDFG
jgi:hypothetical protein